MRILRTLLFSLALLFTGTVFAADGPVRVVYHLVEGLAQASRAMGNIRNHLDADPTAKIVVVAHGSGIDFLLEGALDAKGQPYAGAIGDLANRGVQFRVCNNTLISRGISKDKLVLEASVVPSGVAEVARLQFKEGYAYLRP
ncbi:MAG: DsrE family protein [Burkholderiales bacterium]|nr:DsrE family protein [Burkholderiales bacterium]